MKDNRFIVFLTLLLVAFVLLLSCSSSDPVIGDEEKPVVCPLESPIGFRGLDVSSRAAVDLATFYDNFYVRSFKKDADDTKNIVIPNYSVKNIDGRWVYDGQTTVEGDQQYLKYWDLSAKSYTFAAVTPVPNNSATASFAYKETTVSIDDDGEITFEKVKGNISHDNSINSQNAPDWMVARTVRRGINETSNLLDYDDIAEKVDDIDNNHNGESAVFPKPNTPYAEVPLMFHHIFADVEFKAYATSTITVKKFKVIIPDYVVPNDDIVNQGDYSTVGGWTNPQYNKDTDQDPKRFGDYTYDESRTLGLTPETARTLARHVQIPQEWTEKGRTFSVRIETEDGKVYTGTININEDNNGTNSWKQDKHYIYILKIDTGEGDDNVILFEVDLDKWKWIKGNSIEETETDW